MVNMATGDKFIWQGKELEFIQEINGFCYFICEADAPPASTINSLMITDII